MDVRAAVAFEAGKPLTIETARLEGPKEGEARVEIEASGVCHTDAFTLSGGARGRTDVPRIVDWYMEGKINIDDLITHTMPIDEINTAFDLMHEGKSIRSVVVY